MLAIFFCSFQGSSSHLACHMKHWSDICIEPALMILNSLFLAGIASSELIRGYLPVWSFFGLVPAREFGFCTFDLFMWTEHFVEQCPEELHKYIITFRNAVHQQEKVTKRRAQLPAKKQSQSRFLAFPHTVFWANTDQCACILTSVLIWFLREEGKNRPHLLF